MPYRNESNYSKLSSKDLLEIRKRYNLTQVEIAKLLGIGHRTYRYYEVDEKPIPTLVANALSSLGNISLDEFQGTLTSYDMDRMRRLRDEIDDTLSVGSVDVVHVEKILKQSSKELENVLSKAEK
jgi:transcriptional regulator with XRE-family HTH domain